MICYWCYELRCNCYAILFVYIMFMRVVCCELIVVVVYSAVSPFVLSYTILVLWFILTTFARFFFDCFVVSGGLNIYPINPIELFYFPQFYFQSNRIVLFFAILFCSCACFLFVVLMLFMTKKYPRFLDVGFCFAFLFYRNIESIFLILLFNTSF